MVLEWTDPPFAPGHGVPEMVARAGAEPTLGAAGEKSARVTWEQCRDSRPDLVVCAPCGYDLAGSRTLAEELVVESITVASEMSEYSPKLYQEVLKIVGDGVEALAGIVHPGEVPASPIAERIR